MLNNKSFCIMPFIHLHVNEDDLIKLCCYSHPLKKMPVNFNFNTDTEYNDIRKQMLEGISIKHCETCYQIEDNGGESFRHRDTKEWMSKLQIDNIDQVITELMYYDIRNDNTCNLACRMCYPGASSQLEKEYASIGWQVLSNTRANTLTNLINFSTIKKLYVAGGEPTLMPEFKKFLTQATELGRTDIELRIITNATNINKEIAELLSNFPNKEFTVSIDGFENVNRYIRWPSNWDSIIADIERLYEITSDVSFNISVSMWNICNLSRLVNFLETKFPPPYTILLNEAVVIDQVDSSPFNFPNKELAIADLMLLKTAKSYQTEHFFKNKVDYFINRLQNSTVDKSTLEQFFKYNDILDKSRNIKLIDYIPELEQCRSYLTKQI